jgi:acyl-coenzyme A thioesterase PaaI-like protein
VPVSQAILSNLDLKTDEERPLPDHPPECYACGTDNPASLPLKFREVGDRVVTELTFGPTQTGAPAFAHGGSIATMLDDAIGTLLVARLEQAGVTAKLETNYRRPVMLNEPMRIEAWIEKREGRKVWSRAELRDLEGDLFSDAIGLFVLVEAEHFLQEVGPAELWIERRRRGDPGLGR